MVPMETVIDQRKQLCRKSNTYLAKLVFNQRLIRFLNYDSQMNGFIQDIYRIVQKYGLCEVIYTYARTGRFPAKCAWKSTVNRCVIIPDKRSRFNTLLDTIYSPILINVLREDTVCRLWSMAKSHRKYYPICKILLNISTTMFSVDFNRQCTKCSVITNDIVIHWLCHCPANETLRYAVWDSFVASKGYSAYIDTMFKSPLLRCVNLLTLGTEIEDDRMKNFDIAMRICKMC